jgi:hypothetical protein
MPTTTFTYFHRRSGRDIESRRETKHKACLVGEPTNPTFDLNADLEDRLTSAGEATQPCSTNLPLCLGGASQVRFYMNLGNLKIEASEQEGVTAQIHLGAPPAPVPRDLC